MSEPAESLGEMSGAESNVEAAPEGLMHGLGYGHALVFLAGDPLDALVTVGSRGYAPSSVGSKFAFRAGQIGTAASYRLPVKLDVMSRAIRFGGAFIVSSCVEERLSAIDLPGLADAMSEIPVPMIVQGRLIGALFFKSTWLFAFTGRDKGLLTIGAHRMAAVMTMCAGESIAIRLPDTPLAAHVAFPTFQHLFDDSVFVNGINVIKVGAGQIPDFLIERHLRHHRNGFCKKKVQLAEARRLPETKDNLDTRILFLPSRLDEKNPPIRLDRTGRHNVRFEPDCWPTLETSWDELSCPSRVLPAGSASRPAVP